MPLGHRPFTSSPRRTVNTGHNAQGNRCVPAAPAKSGRAVGAHSRTEGKYKLMEYRARSKGTGGQSIEGMGAGFLREFVVGPRHVEAEPEEGLREAIVSGDSYQ